MNNLLSPYDLGNFQVVEYYQRIKVDELVREAQKTLKKRLVEAQIDALGADISLTTTKTRYNGERFWFKCPLCNKPKGILFLDKYRNLTGCRKCLRLSYKEQRYKGMIESQIL